MKKKNLKSKSKIRKFLEFVGIKRKPLFPIYDYYQMQVNLHKKICKK